MEENTNVFLGTERVGKLMRGYAVPCIISLLVGALYNIVDQIFIANADYLGSYGNAANTVVFPLTVAALAIAVMVGDGCCAYVSINLGKKDVKTAKKSVGNAVVLVLLASAALTAVYLLLAEPILTMFGGRVNVETFRYAKEYFFYIALGVPFYMFGQALNPIIRADGSPKFAMASTLAGAILNTILDPVFIFVCRWGMMGAAVATVLGQIVTAVLAIWYLCNMRVIRPGKGGTWQGAELDGAFHVARGGVRRGFCHPAADLVRLGRRFILDAGFRHFDVCGFGGANSWDISGAKQQSAIKEEILSGRSLERINYI